MAHDWLRHEFKYLISPYEYHVLRQRMKCIMHPDDYANADGEYHIRSLYFDDMNDSSLYEKNAGVYDREKFRIRVYDKSKAVIKLERKKKVENYINKVSSRISEDEFYSIINGNHDFLLKGDELQKLFYERCVTRILKPAVIVDYKREVYTYPVSDVRITFDKWIEAAGGSFDIFDKSLYTVPTEIYNLIIMEVKYNNVLPDVVKDLIKVRSDMQAASKYVLCRMALDEYNIKGC